MKAEYNDAIHFLPTRIESKDANIIIDEVSYSVNDLKIELGDVGTEINKEMFKQTHPSILKNIVNYYAQTATDADWTNRKYGYQDKDDIRREKQIERLKRMRR